MPPALRIESLWKCYAAGIRGCSARAWVLRGLSLTVDPGERVAIIGAPGSGKTTLAECVLGLRAPTAGMIEIAGGVEIIDIHDIRRWGREDLSSSHADRLTSTIVLARRPDVLDGWADRLLVLGDGRLHHAAFRAARRVAERSMLTPSGSIALR